LPGICPYCPYFDLASKRNLSSLLRHGLAHSRVKFGVFRRKELCALNKDTLVTHAQSLDISIHCAFQTAQEKSQQLVHTPQEEREQLVQTAQKKRQQIVHNVQEKRPQLMTVATTERAISGIDYISNAIDYVDSTVDFVLHKKLLEPQSARETAGKPVAEPALSAPEKQPHS
jgi:hypothetical protein